MFGYLSCSDWPCKMIQKKKKSTTLTGCQSPSVGHPPTYDTSPYSVTPSLLSSTLIFFFLSKHLPSPKSGFWTRLVTTMMRREDLITSNTSQTGRRRVVSSPLSKWKPVFSQWQIRLNSHTHSISSFPPQKHSLFIWTRIHKSYFAEGH